MAKREETTTERAVTYVMTFLVNNGDTVFKRNLEEFIPDELVSKLGKKNKAEVIEEALNRLLRPLSPSERDDFTHEPEQSVMVRRVKQIIRTMCEEQGVENPRVAGV